jgi:putative tributyrin esterase
MAFCTLHFRSPALVKACSMNVIFPESGVGEPPFPVCYLLHGLSDDHTSWARHTSIERYVADLPLIVVMPDGGRSFYTDAVEGPAYERHIIEDVIGFVDRTFQTIQERRGRVIGGLSMGGFGAMKLALKFPQLFCSAVAHSAAFDVRRWVERLETAAEMRRIFGPSPAGGPNDLYALAETSNRQCLPALRIDCGIEDSLLEENRAFHRHLEKLGIPHEYEECPGGHTWDYWDHHVQEAIAFHQRTLESTASPEDEVTG